MSTKSKHNLLIIYNILMMMLAVISIAMIVLDYAKEINITTKPFVYWDNIILVAFAVDYFTRLLLAKNKWQFFKNNIWDLLSIIPVNQAFYFFRISRLTKALRLLKVFRLARLVGLSGRIGDFFKTDGFIYYLYLSTIIVLIASSMYCISEKVSFSTALWWSITTATTVGYGDISPTTPIGKFAALLLMLLGIGFIGVLTSSLTNFFSLTQNENHNEEIEKELREIKQENKDLKAQLNRIEQQIKNKS